MPFTGYKHNEVSKVAMANTWDNKLELSPECSEYYAIMVQKMGKQMADYYWNKRYTYEVDRDYKYREICKEINEKCDKFLKSRGINIFNY